jgi:hypothetical protein
LVPPTGAPLAGRDRYRGAAIAGDADGAFAAGQGFRHESGDRLVKERQASRDFTLSKGGPIELPGRLGQGFQHGQRRIEKKRRNDQSVGH